MGYLLYGISEGGLQTQPRAALMILFPERAEQSMAIFVLLSGGFIGVGFFYGPYLNHTAQMAIIVFLCMLGIVGVLSYPTLNAFEDAKIGAQHDPAVITTADHARQPKIIETIIDPPVTNTPGIITDVV